MQGTDFRAGAAWPPTIGPYSKLLVGTVDACRAEAVTAGGAGVLNSSPKMEMFYGEFPEMRQKTAGPTGSRPMGKMFIIWVLRTQGGCRDSGVAHSSSTSLGITVLRAL